MNGQKIYAWVRNLVTPNWADGNAQVAINNRGDLCVAQGLPERHDLVRLGNSYFSIGTAVAPVAAVPTTAAHFALYNNEAPGGKSYVIDFIGTQIAVSAAAAIQIGLWAILQPPGATANQGGTVNIYSLSGAPLYRGKGNTKVSPTITTPGVSAGVWMPVGNSLVIANTADLMGSIESPVQGRYVLPPGGTFGLATSCDSAGSATCTPWIVWHEVQMPLG